MTSFIRRSRSTTAYSRTPAPPTRGRTTRGTDQTCCRSSTGLSAASRCALAGARSGELWAVSACGIPTPRRYACSKLSSVRRRSGLIAGRGGGPSRLLTTRGRAGSKRDDRRATLEVQPRRARGARAPQPAQDQDAPRDHEPRVPCRVSRSGHRRWSRAVRANTARSQSALGRRARTVSISLR
jgi:hypothetical protein